MTHFQRMSALIIFLVTGATLSINWAVRRWVEASLPYGEPMSVFGTVFRLTHSENSGVAFSLLRDSPLVPWLSAGALVAVVVYLARPLHSSALGRITVGLIVGGGIANLLDRLDDGRVTDYLDWGVGTWRYATFNLPDVCIVLGIAGSMWVVLKQENSTTSQHAAKEHAQ